MDSIQAPLSMLYYQYTNRDHQNHSKKEDAMQNRDEGQGYASPGQREPHGLPASIEPRTAESRRNGNTPVALPKAAEPATTNGGGGATPPRSIESKALVAAKQVAAVGASARQVFIDRETAISVLEWAAVCGEHACLLGPPGTGKSALARYFADGLGLGFFRLLLNPDTTRDEMVGPIDPFAFDKGVWDRCWMGLATCPVVFFDEVGRASSQVINMTLDAMEERLVTSAGRDKPIPLHILIGASNSTLSEDLAAAWDRFTLRLEIKRLDRSSKIHALLTRKRGVHSRAEGMSAALHQIASASTLNESDLVAMRLQARFMAENPTEAVAEIAVKLWSKIGNITGEDEHVSDRRWERLLVVAAGRALLHGATEIRVEDLIVAQHMLWERPGSQETIFAFVRDIVDAEAAEIAATTRLIEELEKDMRDPHPGENEAAHLERKARLSYRAGKLIIEIRKRKKTRTQEWDTLKERLAVVTNWAMEG